MNTPGNTPDTPDQAQGSLPHGQATPDLTPGEQARLWRVSGVDGVELMRARFLTQNFSRHSHDCYALGVIEQGALAFSYRGSGCVAPAGSVNLVVPGEVHDGHAADGAGWAYRMCYIDPDWLARVGGELGFKAGRLPFFRAGVLHDPDLARMVLALHHSLEARHVGLLERQTRLWAVLARWVSGHAEDRPGWPEAAREPAAVARAKAWLLDRLDRPDQEVGLDDLAAHVGLSPFHLARVFAAGVGLPPHAFLIQARVARARECIRAGRSLAEAALASGFADQSHLTRRFKRQYGVTPGTYQRAWRKIVQDC